MFVDRTDNQLFEEMRLEIVQIFNFSDNKTAQSELDAHP
jgi:hypothetical protein